MLFVLFVFSQRLKRGKKMKEVTADDWVKNPTPRMMWVWDNSFDVKEEAIQK